MLQQHPEDVTIRRGKERGNSREAISDKTYKQKTSQHFLVTVEQFSGAGCNL